MARQYTAGCLTIRDSLAADTHVAVSSVNLDSGAEISGNESGSLYEEFQAITRFDPVAGITSKCLATLLGFIGIDGQCVGADFDVTRCDIVTRHIGNCQDALSGTPHLRDRISQGLLTLDSLTADRGVDAMLSLTLHALTDGSNAPIARTDGVALPTPVVAERFTLGLIAIAGATFPEVESVSLNFGVGVTEKTPALGAIWTDAIGVLTVRPTLTIRGRDLSKVTDALLTAAADQAGHADTVIQLIKRKESGTFVNFATAEHIAITVAGLVVPENILSAASNQRATHTLTLAAAYDGSNAPVLFDLASTYDTTPP